MGTLCVPLLPGANIMFHTPTNQPIRRAQPTAPRHVARRLFSNPPAAQGALHTPQDQVIHPQAGTPVSVQDGIGNWSPLPQLNLLTGAARRLDMGADPASPATVFAALNMQ
jgi:hypothetical protein